MENCFACGRPLNGLPLRADTRDDQVVYVGPDCFRKIQSAGPNGYQPPLGGPRLWLLESVGRDVPKFKATRRKRSGAHDRRRRF